MAQNLVRRAFIPTAAAVFFLFIGGCGYGDHVPVQGKVMVDGAPLENGTITFTPTTTGPKTIGGAIKDGKYSILANDGPSPGMYRVAVIVRKKTGRQVGTPGDQDVKMDEVVDMQTSGGNMSADVKAQANTIDFTDLKTAGLVHPAPGDRTGQVKAVGD